jgi:small subunit ribosomal protein S17
MNNKSKNDESKIVQKKWNGMVVSDKNDKTIVVEVKSIKSHPIYKKKFTKSRKYHVHDELNEYKNGDMVEFVETKPISKKKFWIVVKK